MATQASFTIRQVAPDQPDAATTEPSTDSTDRPTRRRTIKDIREKRGKEKKEEKKSRKPPGNKWLQQKIPACRPVWMAKHVLVLFFIVGIIFIALGIGFLVTTARLKNQTQEYTNCMSINRDAIIMELNSSSSPLNTGCGVSNISAVTRCEEYLCLRANLPNTERMGETPCMCQVQFTLEDDMDTPVFMYYSLHNYFQNHRRFVNSWSGNQLRADDLTDTGTCEPLRRNGSDDDSGSIFLPCGVIANSLFNDTLNITSGEHTLRQERDDISWQSDRDTRFQNNNGDTTIPDDDNVQPKNWQRNITELPNSLQNEDLIVWFRVSAFPNFIKLYARLRVEGMDTLPAGNYTLNVNYNYPVNAFDGGKYLFLSEKSWLGGKNNFLGIAYIVVGVLSIVSAVALLIIHLKFSRWKESDKDYLHREH